MTYAELKAEHIGMGSKDTWHGTPDAHVRGCSIVYNPGVDDDRLSVSSSESDGTTTPLEAKRKIKFWDNVDQLVATCVMSSFTEHSLHPHKNTLVPTIIMDPTIIQVCLYDCENDILLVSEPKGLCKKRGGRNFQCRSFIPLAY